MMTDFRTALEPERQAGPDTSRIVAWIGAVVAFGADLAMIFQFSLEIVEEGRLRGGSVPALATMVAVFVLALGLHQQ